MRIDDVGGLPAAAAEGDTASWNALVDRFGGLVWSVARAQGLADAGAEEVFQTTWLRFAEHIGHIEEPHTGVWLVTTARTESFRIFRIMIRFGLTGGLEAADRSPERPVASSEESASAVKRLFDLWEAFDELPPRCTNLLRVLVASPPPTHAEVAAAFEMPIEDIGPARARCLGRLRELLAKRDGTPAGDDAEPPESELTDLEASLRRAAERFDPLPPRLHDAALAAYSLRTPGAEPARLTSDSFTAVRGPAGPRVLTFTADATTVEVGIADSGLTGHVLPAGPAEIEVRSAGRTIAVSADAGGRFTAGPPASGPLSLRCRLAAGPTVVTDWISIH